MLDSPPRSGGCDVRVLFVSDTHIGLDWPARPRVVRSRRGDDFFQKFERALEPARARDVDVVVHSGDLRYRSQVPACVGSGMLRLRWYARHCGHAYQIVAEDMI
jgi:3',5'-cyclic AMP phosphodiesterase CpdA